MNERNASERRTESNDRAGEDRRFEAEPLAKGERGATGQREAETFAKSVRDATGPRDAATDRTGALQLKGTVELHVLPDVQTTFQLFAAHQRRVETPWAYPIHAHAMFEVNVVTSGMQRFSIEGATFEQRAGDIVLVRPGERHSSVADADGEMAYFCLHFQADDPVLRRRLLAFDRGMYPSDSALSERIGPPLRRLMELATTASAGDAEMAPLRMQTLSATYALLAALAEHPPTEDRAGAGDGRDAAVSAQAARLAAEIAGRIERDAANGESETPIADIARSLGYSPAYCGRVFRDAYGMSPRAYRSAVVLREAKLLLLSPDLGIEAIAKRLGYDDPSTFSKQFRRWTGMSPKEFRTL